MWTALAIIVATALLGSLLVPFMAIVLARLGLFPPIEWKWKRK